MENQPTTNPEPEIVTVAEPAGSANICGECHYIAVCAGKPGACVTYTTLACEKFKKKRGRPASTVKSGMGLMAKPSKPTEPAAPKPAEMVLSPIDGKEHIPDANPDLVETKQWRAVYSTLEKLLKSTGKPKHVCVIGPAGIGKNEILFELCHDNNWPCLTVNCSGDMRAAHLVGRPAVEGDKIYFQDGPLVQAMENGWILNLDEVNAIDGDITFVLHGALTSGKLCIANDSRVIRAHPNFRVVATCNPLNYVGVKPLNEALKSRFRFIQMGYDSGIDKKLLAQIGLPDATNSALMKIISFVRHGFETGDISQPFGHRTLAAIVSDMKDCGFDLMSAMELNYLSMLNETDREAIKTLLNDLARVSSQPAAAVEHTYGKE
jgi:MoxR-like ATPase